MIPIRDPETNMAVLEAMVGQLERFLAGDDLSRRLLVDLPDRKLPTTMTLGVMLHLIATLEREAPQMPPHDRARLAEARVRIEATRRVHVKAYDRRLQRELKSHLDSWAWFLDDCDQGADNCFDNYANEAWIRTRIHQVLGHAAELGLHADEARARLATLDERLEAVFQLGAYVGPPGGEEDHPRDECWWLYGRPIRH